MNKTRRDPFFDMLKAFAMFLVVFGHTRWACECVAGNPFVDNCIVGMNMPIFFIVSGYFSFKMVKEGEWRNLGRRLAGYIWPVGVVSLLFAVLTVALGTVGYEKGVLGYAARWFLFAPWFLWTLSICLIITFVAVRVRCAPFAMILASLYVLLPVFVGFWQIGNVQAMLPFFMFGMFVMRRGKIWQLRGVGPTCLVIYVALALCLGSYRDIGLSFYGNAVGMSTIVSNPHQCLLLFARIALGLVGAIGVFWSVDVCSRRVPRLRRLACLGTTTLGVYIFHQWILSHCAEVTSRCRSFVASFVLSCALLLLCHSITVILQSSKTLRKSFWGLWWESSKDSL